MNSNGQVDLLAFLDYLSVKGLMNSTTAGARKGAVRTLFSILDDSETADVMTLDLEEVARRFLNKRGSEFKPESVKVYKSRVASAIEDFKKYRADPLNFKTSVAPKQSSGRTRPSQSQPTEASDNDASPATAPPPISAFVSPSEMVFPIPLRPNVVVKIVGLPDDLTKLEAARVANVINALAKLEE